jgi:CheY-like chemotaxis protein
MTELAPGQARILLVEDDEDTRYLLAVALGREHYLVETAAGAAEGLLRLRRYRYHLVVTDYDLPGQTGSAMLKEAAAQGLLRHTAAVVVTAHPQPEPVAGADVIHKPLDLEHFLRQVRHILDLMVGEATPAPTGASRRTEGAVDAPHEVALVLYVSAESPASQRARRHLEAALAGFEPGRIRLEVCDVADDPGRGEIDHVVFTPTLVARCGGLATWVLGDLADRTMLLDLLHVCGVEPKR